MIVTVHVQNHTPPGLNIMITGVAMDFFNRDGTE